MQYNTRDLRLKRLDISGGVLTTSSPFFSSGGGDNVTAWTGGIVPQIVDIRVGTAGSPDTLQAPIFKLSRTVQMSATGLTGDASDYMAGIISVVSGTASNEVQTVGVMGYARSASISNVTNGADDACGIYGVGRITGVGTGYGIGGYIHGRRDTETGNANGLEVRCDNQTTTNGVYSAVGASKTMGLWITSGGQTGRINGVAVAVGLVAACQWEVGIGIPMVGATSPVTNSSIRDDSTASTSIDIRGTHQTAAINIQASSGIAIFQPSNASSESIRIPAGIAPTTPVSGGMFFDGTNLRFYDGTTTRTFLWI